MNSVNRTRTSKFLRGAFCVWENNPTFNLSAFCTIIGLITLGMCALIQTFGVGVAPDYIIEVGKAGFYFGIGGAYEKSNSSE